MTYHACFFHILSVVSVLNCLSAPIEGNTKPRRGFQIISQKIKVLEQVFEGLIDIPNHTYQQAQICFVPKSFPKLSPNINLFIFCFLRARNPD